MNDMKIKKLPRVSYNFPNQSLLKDIDSASTKKKRILVSVDCWSCGNFTPNFKHLYRLVFLLLIYIPNLKSVAHIVLEISCKQEFEDRRTNR